MVTTRQEQVRLLIRNQRIGNQSQIVKALKSSGIEATQSSVSRDLANLGVVKVDGWYQLPSIAPGESGRIERLDVCCAGDNLIILRTGPGEANRVGYDIDHAGWVEIAGTIAGDDAVFIAVEPKHQRKVVERVMSLYGGGLH